MRRLFKLRNLLFFSIGQDWLTLIVSQQSVLDRNIERQKTLQDDPPGGTAEKLKI